MKKLIFRFALLLLCIFQEAEGFLTKVKTASPATPPPSLQAQGVVQTSTIAATTDALTLRDDFILETLYTTQRKTRLPPSLFFGRLYENYMELLKTKPIQTKSITSAAIAGFGNILGQRLTAFMKKESFHLNQASVITFVLTGLFYVGPFYHMMYEQLWKLGDFMEKRWGSSKLQQVFAQIFLDQTFGAFLFFPLYFITYEIFDALVGGRVPLFAISHNTISKQLLPVILANWKIWPIANYINFRCVPPPLRNLFTNVLGVFWNAFLCLKMA